MFTVRTQRNGEFFSVGELMETMDGSWRDDQDVSDWAIYKGNWGALTTKPTAAELAAQVNAGCPECVPEEWLEKKERENEDYTDVWQLTQAVDGLLQRAIGEGALRPDITPDDLLRTMYALCYARQPEPGWKPQVLRLLDIFIDGLRLR